MNAFCRRETVAIRPCALLRWLPVGLMVAAQLSAQTVPPSPTAGTRNAADATVVLSPFVVSTDTDTGYQASSTLAGSRVRTNLVDLGAPISVMTADLLNDLGAVNIQEAIGFATGVENVQDSLDPSVATGDADQRRPNETRVRGIGAASITRNYFPTSIRIDTYNSSRLDISRGPNSILFGLGSPAGVINTTTQRAEFRNFGGVEVRVDLEDSHRFAFRLNREIVPQKLAVFVAGLHEQTKDWQAPSMDHQNRGYIALQARPFPQTTITADYENYWNYRQLPRSRMIFDGVTPWINAGRPTWAPGQAVNASYFVLTGNNLNPVYVESGSLGAVTQFDNRSNTVRTKAPHELLTGGDAFQVSLAEKYFPRQINFTGNASYAELDGQVFEATLEQRIGLNFTAAIAFNREEYGNQLVDLIGGSITASILYADPNRFLRDGQPNPNVGRYYLEVVSRSPYDESATDTWQFTSNYDFDLRRASKWFGHHRFSTLASYQESESLGNVAQSIITSNHSFMPAAAANDFLNASRRLVRRYYIDDPFDPKGGKPYAELAHTVLQGEVDGVYSDPKMPGAVANSRTLNKTKTIVGVLQSYWWDDRVVTTIGARHDAQSVYDAAAFQVAKNLWAPAADMRTPSQASLEDAGNTASVGVAFHATKAVSLYYNHADSFQLGNGSVNVNNGQIPGASGKGEDYGLGLRLLDDRIVLRVSRYHSTQAGGINATFRPYFRNTIADIEDAVAQYSGRPRDPNMGPHDLFITSDLDAKGYEFEAAVNPTRAWRIALNASRQETVQTNIAPDVRAYIAQRLGAWQPYFKQAAPLGSTSTIEQLYESQIKFGLDLAQASEGFTSPRQSEWRVNAITNYNFSNDSKLKGFSIGGATRWAAAPVIGYPNRTLSSGQVLPDVGNPYYGSEFFRVDGWIAYDVKLSAKLRARVQLNVRNVLDESDLIPTRARSTGEKTNFAAPDPRLFVLSTKLMF